MIGIGTGLALSLLLGETTMDAIARAGGHRIMLMPVGLLVGSVIAASVGLAAYSRLMRLVRGRAVCELAGPGRLRELGTGLVWGTALMMAVIAVLAAMGAYRIVAVGWDKGILIGLVAGIMGGVGEELLFRGVLLRLLEAWLGSWWALTVTAVLFGAVHLSNAGASPLGAAAIALEAGILLGACYLVTRRLWFAIGLHAAYIVMINTVASVLFAYGKQKQQPEYGEQALRLLEQIPPERNSIVKAFTDAGVPVKNACDSQALIQLRREYCDKRKCLYCRIGFRLIKSAAK